MAYDYQAEQQFNALHQPVAYASADRRAMFLKKVFAYFFLGILIFAGVAAAATAYFIRHPELIMRFWWGAIIAWMILGFLLGRILADPNKGLLCLLLYAVGEGVILAPLLAIAYFATGGFTIVAEALILTVLIFGGLTGYVYVTKEDFSFLGGFLTICGMILLGVVIFVLIFGGIPTNSIWAIIIPAVFIVFFSLYVLYDTSVIMKHLPEQYAAAGAAKLFLDFAGLLYYVLILLLSLSGEN